MCGLVANRVAIRRWILRCHKWRERRIIHLNVVEDLASRPVWREVLPAIVHEREANGIVRREKGTGAWDRQ